MNPNCPGGQAWSRPPLVRVTGTLVAGHQRLQTLHSTVYSSHSSSAVLVITTLGTLELATKGPKDFTITEEAQLPVYSPY